MLRVGLTGGYATGKTFVASELARLGCHVIHADKLGHAVLEPGGEAYAPVIEVFGPEILDERRHIDRKKLASIVFQSPERLEELTKIVHPAVSRLEKRLIDELSLNDPHRIAVYEAAILVETGRHALYDRLILTTTNEEIQIERGMNRDDASREQVLARIAKQLPSEKKRSHAHYVIDTSGTKEDTIRQVEDVYRDLKRLAQGGAE